MNTERKLTLQDIIKVRNLQADINASYAFMNTWVGDTDSFLVDIDLGQMEICWLRKEANRENPVVVKTATCDDLADLMWRVEALAENLNRQVWNTVF